MPAIDKPTTTAATRGRGRPSKFTDALAAEICERLGKGEPLAAICRDARMPKVQTVADWRRRDEGFSVSIARAREEGFDAIAAECLEIADDERHDWKMTQKGAITNEVAIGRARLQVDTRLKLLAKWDPKRYGDKLDVMQATRVEPVSAEQMEEEMRQSPALRREIESMLAKAASLGKDAGARAGTCALPCLSPERP